MSLRRNLLSWIYGWLRGSSAPSYDPSAQQYIDGVESSGGVIGNKAITNAWVEFLKDNSLWDSNLLVSVGASYGYYLDGSGKVISMASFPASLQSHDPTQSNASYRATVASNVLNGKPGFTFSGTCYYRGTFPVAADQSNSTIYMVLNATGGARNTIIGFTSSDTDSSPYLRLEHGIFRDLTDDTFQFYRGTGAAFNERTVADSVVNNDGFMAGMARFKSDGEWTFRKWEAGPNSVGTWGYMETLAAQSSPNFIIGSRGASNQFAGTICEMHVFKGYHTDATANLILAWLRDRYFVTETISDSGGSAIGYSRGTDPYPNGGGGGETATFKQATAIPTHDSVTWEARIENGLSFDAQNTCIIENRNFRSTDPTKGAVELWADYSGKTIIFRNCKFSYQGWAGIKAIDSAKDELRVENCIFYGRDASVDGVARYAVRSQFTKRTVFEHNYVENSGGLLVAVNAGSVGAAFYNQIYFRYNYAKNVNGMMGTYAKIVQTMQINDSTVGSNIDIDVRWNETWNTEDLTHVEDNYNFYCSSGTEGNPAKVEFNFVSGAFYKTRGSSYTGGGIILDSPNGAQIASWWRISWNIMVRVGNYCLGLASAKNVERRGNWGVVACEYSDGTRYQFWTSGMWTDDYYDRNETYNVLNDRNTMGIEKTDGTRPALHHYNNATNLDGTLPAIERNNVTLSGDITTATEATAVSRWNSMKAANGIVCGPYTETTGTLPGTPVINSLSAYSGKYGDFIIITGSNFTRTTNVRIGNTDVLTFCVVSDTSIECFLAAHSDGAVSVTNPTGTGSGPNFDYQSSVPTLSTFSTSSVARDGYVTVTGTNITFVNGALLTGPNTVTITEYRRLSDTQIKIRIPASTPVGTYAVNVLHPDGSATKSGLTVT